MGWIVGVLAATLVVSGVSPLPASADSARNGGSQANGQAGGPGEHHGSNGETDVSVCSRAVPPGVAHCDARLRTDPAARGRSPVPAAGVSPAIVPDGTAYGPADLQAAYHAPSATGGSGQTVAIVDAFDDPNAESDLAAYRSTFGLPACTTANGCFRKVNQSGGTSYPGADHGWAEEISLDVDMVSALCPLCHIVLVEANSATLTDLGTAVNEAVALGANAVSNSWGTSEFSLETLIDSSYFDHPGVAITASSGDSGYGVDWPAASSKVIAVGGTSLVRTAGTFSETAWSGGGSGCSAYEPKPSWQTDAGCARRTVADVSAVADPHTGVWVNDTYGGDPGFEIFGGTSVSSPIVASFYGLANNPSSSALPASYPYAHAGALNDVVSGNNGSCGVSYLCNAGSGYDGPTGLGTPNTEAAFTAASDFGMSAAPSSLSVLQGSSGSTSINTTVVSGSAQSIALSASGAPSGVTASFSPVSVTAGSSSTLSLTVGAATVPGTYTVTVTGTAGSVIHSTSVALTVTPADDFGMSAAPSSLSVLQGSSGSTSINTTVVSGSAQSIALSASGAPSGVTASFSPVSVTAGSSSTLSLTVGAATVPGTYTVTVTGTAGSVIHSTSVALTVTPADDFGMSAAPSSLSVLQGSSGSTSINTTVVSGSAQSIALSASGAPSGVTASFSPVSVTAGSSSTLSLTVGAATVPGTYTVTVTGTAGSVIHSTSVALTVTMPAGSGIVNGGFETGNLSPWAVSGTASMGGTAHGGTYAAVVGSSSITNGDSSIAQTFSAPAGGGTLTFWYSVHCPDTVTYDWATARLRDNTAGSTTTLLGHTCTNNGAWHQVSGVLVAGHSYTITLTSHDDNYPGDPTFTQYDDVVLGAPPGPGVVNGGFETGNLTGWTPSGVAAVRSSSHSGSYAAQLGSTSPSLDSSITQTFTAAGSATKLAFWYLNFCPDTVTYAWATVTLRDNTTATTTTPLPHTCSSLPFWTKVTVNIAGGHNYALTLANHDDNYPLDPVFTLYDDVVIQ